MSSTPLITRRLAITATATATSLAVFPTRAAHAAQKTFTIGYQKGTVTLILAKANRAFEKKLAPLGWHVRWAEFTSGPPMLEALAAGAIHFACTGNSPVIFAQASGTPLVYVAATRPSPKSIAILKPSGSPLNTVTALKGKKVAVAQGSSAHYLLVSALAHAGVNYDDVTKVFLQPADALAAFSSGAIDAWSIWDPFYALAQGNGAEIITNGTGLTPNRGFYTTGQAFARAHPDLLNVAIGVLNELDLWQAAHQTAAAQVISPVMGVPEPVLKVWFGRETYGVSHLTPDIFVDQQKVADAFYQLGLIPKAIDVTADAWSG